MPKKIAVIGMGRFGAALAVELAERGAEVMAIDVAEEACGSLGDRVALVKSLDARDVDQLREADVAAAEEVVVAIGEDFQATEEVVLALKTLEVRKIIARGQTEVQREILKLIGADQVISPEVESAKRVADILVHAVLRKAVDIGGNIDAVTIEIPHHMNGKTLAELEPIARFGVLVIRVVRLNARGDVEDTIMPPRADTALRGGDSFTLVGASADIHEFLEPPGR